MGIVSRFTRLASRPLPGSRTSVPAGAVNVRCQRLVMQSGFEAIRWAPAVIIAVVGGTGWLLWAFEVSRMPALGGRRWDGVIPAGCGIAAMAVAAYVWMAFVVPLAARWMFDHVWLHTRRRPARKPRWLSYVVAGVLGLGVSGIVLALLFARDVAVVLTSIMGFQCGLTLLAASLGRRASSVVVCTRCEYAMGSWRAAPELCPECGQHWKWPWKAKLGTRRAAWGRLILGVGLIAGVGVWMVWRRP